MSISYQLREEYVMSGHPTIQQPSRVPEEFDDINDHCALAFEYYENTYADWLDMKDDFEKYRPILEERYSQCVVGKADLS